MSTVVEVMRSPLQRNQRVLTLSCGHLWSEQGPVESKVGDEHECLHCEKGKLPMVGPNGLGARLLKSLKE